MCYKSASVGWKILYKGQSADCGINTVVSTNQQFPLNSYGNKNLCTFGLQSRGRCNRIPFVPRKEALNLSLYMRLWNYFWSRDDVTHTIFIFGVVIDIKRTYIIRTTELLAIVLS